VSVVRPGVPPCGLEGGSVGVFRSVAARVLIRRCSWRKAARGKTAGVAASLHPVLPTASGMAPQCLGWRRDGGDGCTGPMVTEGTRLTNPTSRHGPVRAWNRRPPPFECSAVLFRGRGAPAVVTNRPGKYRIIA
jgi:hypothetical protein